VHLLSTISRPVQLAVAGLCVWFALVGLHGGTLGPIGSLLMLAPLVVVPLGLGAIRPQAMWICIGSIPAVASLVLRAHSDSRSLLAVALAACWATATGTVAILVGVQWLVKPVEARFNANYLLQLVALIELFVAAIWLVAACLRIELLGFSQTIVLLTAVHFHFAGFGACSVALVRRRRSTSAGQQRWATTFAVLVLSASPVVAIGHLTVGALELLGGTLLTIGIWGVAAIGWRQSASETGFLRGLMVVGALAPIVPMLFALQYGLTRVSDVQQISFNTITLIHGGLNAFGFLSANLLAEQLSKSPNALHEV
jgi:YndJ-like protein